MLTSPMRKQRGFMRLNSLLRAMEVPVIVLSLVHSSPLGEYLSNSPESVCVLVPLVDQLALCDHLVESAHEKGINEESKIRENPLKDGA